LQYSARDDELFAFPEDEREATPLAPAAAAAAALLDLADLIL